MKIKLCFALLIFSFGMAHANNLDADLAAIESSAASSGAAAAAVTAANTKLIGARAPTGVPEFAGGSFPAAGTPFVKAAVTKVAASLKELVALDASCQGVFEKVNMICHTEQNVGLSSTIAMVQGLMTVAGGVTNSCSNFGKAMDLAKKGMALYTAGCSAAQVLCSSKCGGTLKALIKFEAEIKATQAQMNGECIPAVANLVTGAMARTDCDNANTYFVELLAKSGKEKLPTPVNTVSSKAQICQVDVPGLIAAAIVNLGALAQSQNQSEKCKEDAESKKSCELAENKTLPACSCDIASNKALPSCIAAAAAATDCGLPANADKPLCICKASPRLKGCEGVATSLATNSSLTGGAAGGTGAARSPGSVISAGATAPNAADALAKALAGKGTDGSGSGATNGGEGGASSAGLSSSGDGASKAEKLADKAAAGNANILGTESGGGGGMRSGGYGGYTSPEYRSKLQKYASKNGIAPKIAGNSWSDQVTGIGGRSNFDKVKDRLQANKPSLLGQ